MWVTDSPKKVKRVGTIERCNQSVYNPVKTTKMGMDDMEEVPGVYGEYTEKTFLDRAFG
jgi:hypothetical protein